MTISYDGSEFNGYQKQPNGRTVQEELEGVLRKINGNKDVSVSASGRTDAGVHAINQKAHFDLEVDITCDKLLHSMNSMLPGDIYVKQIEEVSDNSWVANTKNLSEVLYEAGGNAPAYEEFIIEDYIDNL